jgi:uncharacterized protein (TIGR02246 family)
MKKILLALAVAWAVVVLAWQGVSSAQAPEAQQPTSSQARTTYRFDDQQQRAQIEDVIHRYEVALNDNDLEGVVALYTADAAVLAPNAPTAVGSSAVRDAYTAIFDAIDLDLTFSIADVKVVSPSWAIVRSTSSGTITVNANGAEVPSSNQELFVLQCTGDGWKLARYAFSSVLPAA